MQPLPRPDMQYLKHNPVTSKPGIDVPAGACDCHCHIFGDPAVYPFVENRTFTPHPASLDDYSAMLATLGVERAVVVQPSMYGLDNRCTLDAVAQLGRDRARAVVMIDAETGGDEIGRMHETGARGVRFITLASGGAPLEQLQAVAAKVADFGWHIQMYVTVDSLAEFQATIRDLPVPVVFDHMAHLMPDASAAERDLVYRLVDTGNVWVKLTPYRASLQGPPFADVDPTARDFLARAPERCVWGSDWPHPKLSDYMPDDGQLLDRLAVWTSDAALRRRVLVDNPARLYGFSPPA